MCTIMYIRGRFMYITMQLVGRFMYTAKHFVTNIMCKVMCVVTRCVYQSAPLGPADEHSNERSVSPHVAPVPSLRGGGCVGRQHGLRTPSLLP